MVVAGQSVDVFNPKCVRASAGALFHLPVALVADVTSALTTLHEAGLRTIGTAADGPVDYDRCDLTGPVALLLGNEAAGLPKHRIVETPRPDGSGSGSRSSGASRRGAG